MENLIRVLWALFLLMCLIGIVVIVILLEYLPKIMILLERLLVAGG